METCCCLCGSNVVMPFPNPFVMVVCCIRVRMVSPLPPPVARTAEGCMEPPPSHKIYSLFRVFTAKAAKEHAVLVSVSSKISLCSISLSNCVSAVTAHANLGSGWSRCKTEGSSALYLLLFFPRQESCVEYDRESQVQGGFAVRSAESSSTECRETGTPLPHT